jgi:uncharacterized protein (DUF2267 family)
VSPQPTTPPDDRVPAELRASHPVLQRIERSVKLPGLVTGAGAFAATMCLLLLRVRAAEATHLRQALPEALQDLIFRCAQEREEEPTQFKGSEFLEVLASELGAPRADAERIALAVFGCVREVLPLAELKRLSSQLPHDLNELWRRENPPASQPGAGD